MKLSVGDAVMLGSLDRTARRHQVILTWCPASSDRTTDIKSVERVTVRNPTHVAATATRWKNLLPRSDRRSVSDGTTTAADSVTPGNIDVMGEPSAESAAMGQSAAIGNDRLPMCGQSDEKGGPRRFSVPLFSEGGVSNRTMLLHEIAHGKQVRIYARGRSDSTGLLACAVVERLERWLIQFVESSVGVLTDSDCDGYLTVVLEQLETPEQVLTGGEPVRGCVRAADILAPSEFGGDIIYLSEDLTVDAFQFLPGGGVQYNGEQIKLYSSDYLIKCFKQRDRLALQSYLR